MNILVLLRVGRDPASFTVNRKAEKIFVHRDEWRAAPADLNALELALQLGAQGHTVTAMALGGAEAEEALYDARARGAAHAVWVKEEALRELDAGPLVAVLQRVIERVGGVGLVLMGATVEHADLAQVGPRLAVALDAKLFEAAEAVRLENDGVTVTSFSFGRSTISAERSIFPVVTVYPNAAKPRYPSATNIIRFWNDPGAVETIVTADLGLDEEALRAHITRRGERFPIERTFGQLIEASPDDAAQRLATELGWKH